MLKRLKVDVNSVYQKVESLSGGRQQSVAIARAISFSPRVVILDEPTANLSVMATGRLLETMLELKKQGVAQIIISHRLVDIFAVGDRVMVLKRGENVGDRHIETTDEHEVLEIIVSGTRERALAADEDKGLMGIGSWGISATILLEASMLWSYQGAPRARCHVAARECSTPVPFPPG